MATIQKVKRRSDFAYRVLIRQAGMKPVTKTFNNKRSAVQFVNSIESDRNKLLAYTQSKSQTVFSIIIDEYLNKEYKGSRLNDERVKEKEVHFDNMKKQWREHEKDVENHLQIICKNNVITYISQEEFPHPRNKPDNSIEIMDQLIVFDAKSPANDNLSNFSNYIKIS